MNIDRNNYEEWLLRKIDGDLNASEEKALDKFLAAHPEYKMELAAFEKTVLAPEPIVFKNKKSLYREAADVKVISIWRSKWLYGAAAASIALVVGISVWFYNDGNNVNTVENNVVVSEPPAAKEPVYCEPIIFQPYADDSGEATKPVKSYVRKQTLRNESLATNNSVDSTSHQGVYTFDENNFANAVTNRELATLQPLETYPVIQFQLNQTARPLETRDAALFAQNKRNESTAARLVTNALRMSGNDNWARAFQRYSRIAEKQVEVSLNSDKLNLHKTLFNFNN